MVRGGRISSTFKRFLRFGVGRDFCGPPGEFLDHASEDHAMDRVKRVLDVRGVQGNTG